MQLAQAVGVEAREREYGGREHQQVHVQPLIPVHRAEPVAGVERRQHQHGQQEQQRVVEIGGEVEHRLDLCGEWEPRAQDARQELAAGLGAALRPPVLLRLEAVHLGRHLPRRHDVRQEHEAPAFELGAVAEVEILGERVVLPASRRLDGGAAPHARGAVEIEEPAGPAAAAVLEDEVGVELNSLDLGEQRLCLVEVAPARLHHAHARVPEVRQRAAQEIRRRLKVRVENRDVLPGRRLEPRRKRARLEPGAVEAVPQGYVDARGGEPAHRAFCDLGGLVRRVVQHLNLQERARIVQATDRLQQRLDHIHLVVDGELDRHARMHNQGSNARGGGPVLPVEARQMVAVPAVG